MPVRYLPGQNLIDDDAHVLVNNVNCAGRMGKGLALAFADRWPRIVGPYRRDCHAGKLRPGECILYPLGAKQRWAALATKDQWRDPSRMHWVESGLIELAGAVDAAGLFSIAIAPPGCGEGKLDWRVVEPLVLQTLRDFDVRIYGEKTT